jgi:hypothetical protein
VSRTTAHEHPLGLTVHSVPDLDAASLQSATRTRGARLKLLLLLLVCASPVIASYFTYYVIRPDGRRNYGELITPQRPLPAWTAMSMDGQTVPMDVLKHQWLLVTVADSACDTQCVDHLFVSRQIRESLGKDKDRMDWVWLRTGEGQVPDALRDGLHTATVLQLPMAQLQQWLQPAAGHALSDHLYVVDPMGNWMMRFPAQLDVPKARKDLERLMRASNSWDQAGRP